MVLGILWTCGLRFFLAFWTVNYRSISKTASKPFSVSDWTFPLNHSSHCNSLCYNQKASFLLTHWLLHLFAKNAFFGHLEIFRLEIGQISFNRAKKASTTWQLPSLASSIAFILVPRATRRKMSLTSSSEKTLWLALRTRNENRLYTSHFTSSPDGGNFAGALYEKKGKQMTTVPDRSEGIIKVFA